MSARLPVLADDMKMKSGIPDMYSAWESLRGDILAPFLQSLVSVVSWLMIIQLADVFLLWLGRCIISITKYRCHLMPENADVASGKGSESEEPLLNGCSGTKEQSLFLDKVGNGVCCGTEPGTEAGGPIREGRLPKVLIQIPMCNERECYQQSMMAVCGMDWPLDRLLIQVLDDSDVPEIRSLISSEVEVLRSRGAPIIYLHRTERVGHKAGNLRFGMEAMGRDLHDFQFVAIFDADFMPPPDFLRQTVPFFRGRPDLALVQARWIFTNAKQNLITRLQDIAECYHFEIEQQVMSWYSGFFGFNGTAGVWRVEALEMGGGWEHRTTVEDMDIAVRAHLQGWKFVFLNRVRTLCELPSTYASYCKQQHRWFAGPMQLFRLTLWQTVCVPGVPLWKKLNLIVAFFWLRKLLLPLLIFLIIFILVPAAIAIPELEVPLWLAVGAPLTLSALHVAATEDGGALWCLFLLPNMLFENLMALTKACAITAGLLGSKSMGEWVVTQKSGTPVQLVQALSNGCGGKIGTDAKSMGEEQSMLKGDYVSLPSTKAKTFLASQPWHPDRDADRVNGAVEELRPAVSVGPKKSQRSLFGFHMRELMLGAGMVGLALWSFCVGDGRHSCLMGLQGAMLLAAGFNLLGDWHCL